MPSAIGHFTVPAVRNTFILLAASFILSTEVVLERAKASPIIDDAQLESAFVAGLQQEGVEGLTGEEAKSALADAQGKSVEIEAASASRGGDYAEVCQSVVVIGSTKYCKDCQGAHMAGISTGWIVDPRGRIMTNQHVLEDEKADELGVMTFDGRVFPVRQVLAADANGDAAILEIDPGDEVFPALVLADAVRTGEAIQVVGHPDGRFYSCSQGVLSRVYMEGNADDDTRRTWITITADYGVGSSGAPVLNSAGEVVGMVSSTSTLLADADRSNSILLGSLQFLLGIRPDATMIRSGEDVQMVFRDCVSAETIRKLVRARE